MTSVVLLDVVKMEHEERIRRAEKDRMVVEAIRRQKRPSALRNLLLWFVQS